MRQDQIRILENIFQTISDSKDPQMTLDRIVRMVAEQFDTDACSVYVYDPTENRLSLRATVGLRRESVDTITMDVKEGLTGLVVENMKPVFVKDPAAHPRFKYYADSGEEIFKTFLGLPLIYHQKLLGVLVIQTIDEDGIQEEDLPVFVNIATQISATVAYSGLLEKAPDRPRKDSKADGNRITGAVPGDSALPWSHLRGEPVFERVAMGYVHYLAEHIDFDQVRCHPGEDPEIEIRRIEKGFSRAASQIREIAAKAWGAAAEDSAIIDAHLMFLTDTSLKRRISERIRNGDCAEYALREVIFEYVDMFRGMDDPYLSERGADVMDIGRRVLGNLVGENGDPHEGFIRPTILIASDLSPVDLLAIRQPNLKGIVLARGGRTSHTVILAKSLEIPIVIGVENLLDSLHEGDFLIVDGTSGFVFVNPNADIRAEYDRRQDEYERADQELRQMVSLPAVTTDGFAVRMGANIGLLSDTELVRKYGADHIGLYRTEFPFLLRKTFPTEDEQVELYRKVIQKSEGRTVTIRTFDVGGDKYLSYMEYPKEANPFLGWRSIRISLDMSDIFTTQIRAILRASAYGKVKILFPMVSNVEEIRKVIELVEAEKADLDREKIFYDKNIPVGIMLEVPAAVTILDRLLRYVDFVSIGTNDLIQYLLAVDRNNKRVASRYNALHPSVISTIATIIEVCRRFDKPVSICGEAAANPACIFLYIGMGADRISMNPSSLPQARHFIREVSREDARKALADVLVMEDAAEIASYLKRRIEHPTI